MTKYNLNYGDVITLANSTPNPSMKYLVAETNDDINFNRDQAQTWEHFIVLNPKYPKSKGLIYDGDDVALLNYHGKFVSHSSNNLISEDGKIESNKIWNIYNNLSSGSSDNIAMSSGATPIGLINLKANNGKYLNSSGGNAVLDSSSQKIFIAVTDNYKSDFPIPRLNSPKFSNCCNTITMPSKYGSIEVYEFKRHDLICVDLRGLMGEKGYFIELYVSHPQSWSIIPMMFPNGIPNNLIEGQWLGQGAAPNYLILNDYIPSEYFGECVPTNAFGTPSPSNIYGLKIAIGGNDWLEEVIYFKVI